MGGKHRQPLGQFDSDGGGGLRVLWKKGRRNHNSKEAILGGGIGKNGTSLKTQYSSPL